MRNEGGAGKLVTAKLVLAKAAEVRDGAESEAQRIIDKAKEEADQIIARAEADVEQILLAAAAQVARMKEQRSAILSQVRDDLKLNDQIRYTERERDEAERKALGAKAHADKAEAAYGIVKSKIDDRVKPLENRLAFLNQQLGMTGGADAHFLGVVAALPPNASEVVGEFATTIPGNQIMSSEEQLMTEGMERMERYLEKMVGTKRGEEVANCRNPSSAPAPTSTISAKSKAFNPGDSYPR